MPDELHNAQRENPSANPSPAHRGRGLEFGWLERLLVVAVVALVLQLFPGVIAALDPRTWTRGIWLGLNLAVILALFAVRFGPEVIADRRERRKRQPPRRKQKPVARYEATAHNEDYQTRAKRDADWRDRAKKRLPWR